MPCQKTSARKNNGPERFFPFSAKGLALRRETGSVETCDEARRIVDRNVETAALKMTLRQSMTRDKRAISRDNRDRSGHDHDKDTAMKPHLFAALLATTALPAFAAPPLAIERFEPARFTGTWYEIAKYPDWSQRHCVSETSAQFSLTEQNTLTVVRRCRTDAGDIEEKQGLARPLGGPASPRMEATFAAPWLQLLPAVWHDYWIVDIDAHYQLAAVSDPQRKSLWLLSRTPHPDDFSYQALLGRLTALGFDITKLTATAQP